MSSPTVLVLDRYAPGYPKRERSDDQRIGHIPLAMALAHEFTWDAHLVAYSVPSLTRRIGMNDDRSGSGLAIWDRLPDGGIPMALVIVDVDAKLVDQHMTSDWWASEHAKIACAFGEQPGYAYTTRGGYRLVWQLLEPFVIRTPTDHAVWKSGYLARLDLLRDRYGIVGDRACKDFPRHYRLPRVLRDPGERTALTLREVGRCDAIGAWSIPVRLQPVRVAMEFIANVPNPTWPDVVDLADARKALRAYAVKQTRSEDAKAARRLDIVQRVIDQRGLVDSANLGAAGLGRDNTVFEAANLIGWLCPEIGPHGAAELLYMSIAAMDCDSAGGKGRAAYIAKARDVYAASVKKLHQAHAQRRERQNALWKLLADSARGLP